MIRNFIKVALRNIQRNKIFSFINIAGLSVGVACCLILVLYIQDELSYDKHHQDGERIFRITSRFSFDDFKPSSRTSPPIAWGIKDEIPEIEMVTRIVSPPGVSQNLISYGDNQFYEENGLIADSTVFNILTYEFLEGNPEKALAHANTVVISKTLARKLFGNEPALNKVININQGGPSADFKVTGVYINRKNSHLNGNFFVSMSSSGWADYVRRSDVIDEWAGQNLALSYVKLRADHSLPNVIEKINTVFLKHGSEDLKALGMTKKLSLEGLEDIYLYSATENQTPRISYLYVVGSIAAFILLIACINFMNLSTAKATKRAMEVGLRKTMGAQKGLLIRQFLCETMVIVVVAMLFSCMIVQLALPPFNQLTGKDIAFNTNNLAFILSALAGITVVTGLVAGSYPAFYLSSFQPASILKGQSALHRTNGLMRRSLVVFQFVIAISLVCAMIVVTRQLTFMQNQNPGFNAHNKIVLPLRTAEAQQNFLPLKNELASIAGVRDVTGTDYIPGSKIFSDFGLYAAGSSMEKAVLVRNSYVEPNYLSVIGIPLIAGTNFPENRNSDSWKTVIVNREAARQLGFTPEKIIGETLYFDWQGERYEFNVIGVMENYHQMSMREKISPILFRVNGTPKPRFVVIEAGGENVSETISGFEAIWKRVNNDIPFEFTFLDENIQKQYAEDRKISVVISIFTAIAMVISCLGLYGLSTYMAERRFKEIGVRKVLGASVQQIAAMMSGEFVKLVLAAFVIAVPLSFYGVTRWLEGFAYKISPDVSLFVLAGSIALLIAIVTISFESVRAASGNPVKALRNE